MVYIPWDFNKHAKLSGAGLLLEMAPVMKVCVCGGWGAGQGEVCWGGKGVTEPCWCPQTGGAHVCGVCLCVCVWGGAGRGEVVGGEVTKPYTPLPTHA